jgi:hypothetical protein
MSSDFLMSLCGGREDKVLPFHYPESKVVRDPIPFAQYSDDQLQTYFKIPEEKMPRWDMDAKELRDTTKALLRYQHPSGVTSGSNYHRMFAACAILQRQLHNILDTQPHLDHTELEAYREKLNSLYEFLDERADLEWSYREKTGMRAVACLKVQNRFTVLSRRIYYRLHAGEVEDPYEGVDLKTPLSEPCKLCVDAENFEYLWWEGNLEQQQ